MRSDLAGRLSIVALLMNLSACAHAAEPATDAAAGRNQAKCHSIVIYKSGSYPTCTFETMGRIAVSGASTGFHPGGRDLRQYE